MKQIICLSTSTYYPMPTRKQNVMNRINAKEILYFDPAISIIAPIKDRKVFKRIFKFLKAGEKGENNITVYSMPPVLPFYNKCRYINKVNQFFAGIYVKSKMKKHGFKKPILWCYSPASCDIIKHIDYSSLVYDCVDRHSAYPGMINKEVVDTMEKDLATKADMVFATAVGLYDTLKEYNSNIELIPNGAAYDIFSKVHAGNLSVPEKLKGISKPIVGFVGMLQDCINYDYIEAIAKEGINVVLIGRTLPGVNVDFLKEYSNITFIDLVPQKELPNYIATFDVCINPFNEDKLSKDVSPLKFYEYLATGKPIVSTKVPLQVLDFADVTYIANNKDEFVTLCKEAIKEDSEEKTLKRLEYAKACSWNARVKQIEDELSKRQIV